MGASINVSPETKQLMIDMRVAGKTGQEIADEFGFTQSWVCCKLKEWDAPKAKHYRQVSLSSETKKKIVSMYESGMSVHVIGKSIGRSGDFVHERLKKWGVELRGAAHERKYKLDEECFSQRTEWAAYFAGLLMADGCVYESKRKSKNKVVSLTSRDKDVLRKFAKFCGTEDRPLANNGDGTFCISFSSNKIADDLESIWGVTQKKSFTAKVVDPLILYNRHFWRGAVDGDGHVGGEKRKCVYFCSASADMAKAYTEYTDSIGVKTTNYKRKNGFNNIYTGGDDALVLARILYSNADVYMNRKMDAAQKMIKKGGDAHE